MLSKKNKSCPARAAVRIEKRARPSSADLRSEHQRLMEALTDLELSRSRYVELYDAAPVGYVTLSRTGVIRQINLTGAQLLGFQRSQLVKNPLFLFIAKKDQRKFLRVLARIRPAAGRNSVELELRNRRGENPIIIELIATPTFSRNEWLDHIQGALIDITDRRRAEEELKHTRDEAENASRAKDDFLAALSHELRTPLNPVLLLASEAARNRDLPPQARADFDTIRKNIELEARLIDDLLDITRISRGKMILNRSELDVHAILSDAISTVQNELEQKRIFLRLDLRAPQPKIFGDAVRLQQIFWNVLKNAVKFTPESGLITIESRISNSTVIVNFADTGIGMNDAEIKHVFDAFSQGTHRFGGLGLGLAISRALVELHSGTIQARSGGKGKGATFSIRLPLASLPKPAEATDTSFTAAPAAASKKQRAANIHILLVEDHEPTRAALTQLLLRRGYKVMGAGSVAEAHSLLKKNMKFQLLISDIGLPDGSGYDLMAELHQQPALKGIALTGYGMEHDIDRSSSAGFALHLTKPIHIESLEDALNTVLKDL